MKRLFIFFLVVLTVFSSSGCKRIKKLKQALIKPAQDKQVVRPVESIELAEAILRPKPYHFTLSRDPFRPLVGKSALISLDDIQPGEESQIKIIGILIKEAKPLALLEVKEGVAVFREGDKLAEYTIKKIEPKKVILEKEDESFVLKIEEEE